MATQIEAIKEEIVLIRKDLDYLKSIFEEDFELSEQAKQAMKEARETPESEYVSFE